MSDLKAVITEDFKVATINEYDRKDIITKQGVDKAFFNKVNRNVTYKRKLGQTNRRYNHEFLERLKHSYENMENDRIYDFSTEFELNKFSPEDFNQILENDIGDLMDSTPENNKKLQEIQTMLKDLYQKHKIQKEVPKDLNELLGLWHTLQKQGQAIVEEEKRKESEKAAKDVKVLLVEDLKPEPENEVIEIIHPPEENNYLDID